METNWALLEGLLAIPALIAIAILWIAFQDRKIRSWKEAPGRIVSSTSVARTIRTRWVSATANDRGASDIDTSERFETRNFAAVRYEFRLGQETYSGDRISLAKDPGNFDVDKVLKRYPEGKIVTVVYDPSDPHSSLLERDDPNNIRLAWKVDIGLALFILVAFFTTGPLFHRVDRAMADTAPKPLVWTLAGFALFVALMALAIRKQRQAAKHWAKTSGKIADASVAATYATHHQAGSLGVTRTMLYVPRVMYQFEVDGVAYQGDALSGTIGAQDKQRAERTIAKFAPNAPVVVFYNPQNPSESSLSTSGGYLVIALWTIAAVLTLAAYLLARGHGATP
jgi:Protein of unknown function (DUF3592)